MQERIEKIKDYFIAFNIAEDTAYAQVRFHNKWDVPNNEILIENFKVKSAQESDGSVYFFSELSNGILNVFDAIDFTIDYNRDLEEKGELFREKIEELKMLFATKTLEELRNLAITVEEVSTLPWKNSSKNNKRETLSSKKDKKSKKKGEETTPTENNDEVVTPIEETVEEQVVDTTNNEEGDVPVIDPSSLLAYAQEMVK